MKKTPILVIVGATASGKTELSIELAKKFNGEIVSADSMQIYNDMNIGTAKPSKEEMAEIPHHLMNFINPYQDFSVADYVYYAHKCIEQISKKKKLPIVVGGTGLYISSLVNDISFEDGESDEEIRCELEDLAKKEGVSKLLEILSEFDSKSAQKLHPNNLRKIIRAIEFYRVTGKTISEHNENTKKKESRYSSLILAIKWDTKKLYERIEKRVDIMMESGFLEEVADFAKKGYTKKYQSMQGIGYRQLLNYFRGLSTLEETVRIIKRDSRRYAKRQMTWFRRDERVKWIDSQSDILKQAKLYTESFLAENDEI